MTDTKALTREQVVEICNQLVWSKDIAANVICIEAHDAAQRARIEALERELRSCIHTTNHNAIVASLNAQLTAAQRRVEELEQSLQNEKFAYRKLSEQWQKTDLRNNDLQTALTACREACVELADKVMGLMLRHYTWLDSTAVFALAEYQRAHELKQQALIGDGAHS